MECHSENHIYCVLPSATTVLRVFLQFNPIKCPSFCLLRGMSYAILVMGRFKKHNGAISPLPNVGSLFAFLSRLGSVPKYAQKGLCRSRHKSCLKILLCQRLRETQGIIADSRLSWSNVCGECTRLCKGHVFINDLTSFDMIRL